MHFSHLQKETERLDDNRYRVTLRYNVQDETEMVIRILSFGPVIRVLEPARFIEQLRDRIERQRRLSAFLPGSTDETAARRLNAALTVMVYAYTAGQYKKEADRRLQSILGEQGEAL